MCTANELNAILREVAKAYQSAYGAEIVKILLYGSYARGDYTEESDIDIVAIVRGERRQLQDKLDQIWDRANELELEYETIISPTVIPYNEYERFKEALPYYRNIKLEGVEVVA